MNKLRVFYILSAVRANRGQAKETRKKFERFGATESAAKTSRELKDTYVQSQVERRSGRNFVSRRNQRGRPDENRGEVEFL